MASTDFDVLMPHTITVKPLASRDGYGKPTFGSPTTYKCLIEEREYDGRFAIEDYRMAGVTVYVNTLGVDIAATSEITLGTTGEVRPITLITRNYDESGAIDSITLRLG